MMEKYLLSKPVRNVQPGGGHSPEWSQCIPAHSLPQCLTVLPCCWASQMPDSSSSKRYFHLFLSPFLPGLSLPKLMPFAVHQTTNKNEKTLFPLLGSMGSDYSSSPQVDLVGPHPFMPAGDTSPDSSAFANFGTMRKHSTGTQHNWFWLWTPWPRPIRNFTCSLNQRSLVTVHCPSNGVTQQGNSSCSSHISSQQHQCDSSQSFTTIKSCPSP